MDTARAQVSKSSERSIEQTHGEPGTKVTLPTGENISKYQQLRRVHIPGFPATTERLPEGIETEDIIKQWPNHLVRISGTHITLSNQCLSLESCLGRPWSVEFFQDSKRLLEIAMLTATSLSSGDRFYCRL